MRIEVKEAEGGKGRKYQDEGKVGRKGESLETEDELLEELGREDVEEGVGEREVEVPELGEADRQEYDARKHRIACRLVSNQGLSFEKRLARRSRTQRSSSLWPGRCT